MEEKTVIERFNKCNFEERIDILTNEFHLVSSSENKNFFSEFVCKFNLTSNIWYNSVIVDTASRLEVVDKMLLDKFIRLLTQKNNYLIKLSVLDYLMDMYHAYPTKEIEPKIHKTLDSLRLKNDRLIVRNQVILAQMYLYKDSTHSKTLLDNLKRTSDYRAHIRLYNTLEHYNMLGLLSKEDLNSMLLISKQKNLGKATLESINHIKNLIKGEKENQK